MTDEATGGAPGLTPSDIKATIIAKLCSTDSMEIVKTYSETIHPWFSIFSQSTLSKLDATTWDTASVDFALLCFAIVLVNSAPQESHGVYILHSEHRTMYLMGRA
jgi:hypothetical protein